MSRSPLLRRPGRLAAAALAAGVALSSLLVAGPAAAAPTDPPGTFSEQNLGATVVSPFAAYRIPALSYLGNGVVVAAWDGRPNNAADSPNPNSIVMRRSTDGGATWDAQRTILAGNLDTANNGAGKFGYSDPSFVYDAETGKLFLFSVYSKNAGYASSTFGNDDANRNIISAQVSESSDGGLSWGAPRLITSIVKPGSSTTNPQPGDVRSMFASSGEGIQLRYGPHAGRLIQQFAGDVRQADGTNAIQAYSVYSDDHGATWIKGANVGTRMDENKTVELSDGRVMLNSRSNNAADNARKVAISTDGGASYGPVTLDTALTDPANNAAIARLFPDAPAGSADAKKLIFTNANNPDSRQNVSARVSCDDGATWGVPRTIRSGFSAYSTVTRLESGQIGVLYESSYSNGIMFAKFSDSWLNSCTPPPAPSTTTVAGVSISGTRTDTSRDLAANPYTAGQSVSYSFTVRNNNAGTVTVTPTAGNFAPLTAPGTGNCRYLSLAPGASYVCTTPAHTVTAEEVAQGYFIPDTTWAISGAASGTDKVLGYPVALKSGIQAPAGSLAGVSITGSRDDAARNVVSDPYSAGETVSYRFDVSNTGPATAAVVPTSGNFSPFVPPGTGNCRYSALPAGAGYNCTTQRYTVTAVGVARGYFVPDTAWNVSGASRAAGRVLGEAVRLK
ncbi:sialidase family protein [Arthrobacter koreensis]|uniref:sialidase family protein n=1 Tax=Arthrobacter koreensis TaxID=199136 RepID=UPI002DBEF952|nr:sialidase family protein [Arthrobacter koreensis]MEB7448721.1 glycoside hydrolase [Arthrobacter koreensis]